MRGKTTLIAMLAVTAAAVGLGLMVGAETDAADAAQTTRLPNGRNLTPIENGVYPQDYFPNTETLAPTEMRIIALGTGMPQVIQKKTRSRHGPGTSPAAREPSPTTGELPRSRISTIRRSRSFTMSTASRSPSSPLSMPSTDR
jgi:hypothetical protein